MVKYVNIMAKVSPECAERIERIRKQGGFRSKYEVVQAAVALMMMYADPEGEAKDPNIVEQVEVLRTLFGSVQQSRELVSRVKPNGGKRIAPSAMIAFYGKESLMLKVVDEAGNMTTTTNVRDILEHTLCKLLPSRVLEQLRLYSRTHRHPTLHAALMAAISAADGDEVGVEVGSLFRELEDSDPRRVKLGIENKPPRAKSKRSYE